MCGIAGFAETPGRSAEPLALLRRLGSAMPHRGPDGAGEWFDADAGVGFAHRRLAIIDLSAEGAQPMHSASGRFIVTFNGEIYNYRALREELTASGRVEWRGHSDTEVLLAAIERWGLDTTLRRCNGMFALALWDRETSNLTLARDRFGEKPLYYGWVGGRFAFASELKALRTLPGWQSDLNRDAVAHLLQFAYIPAPECIYSGLRKLPAGASLTLAWPLQVGAVPEPVAYFSTLDSAVESSRTPFAGSDEEAILGFEQQFDRAVALRMDADVPLGAFLSGGVDSSCVVASMQAQSMRPVRTFSIGFDETGFDESEHARAVAAHLGTEHTGLLVQPGEARDVIPLLPALYDEPFADSSQIPTYLVARLARQHVTVALSGDGGDELFAGYNRHAWAPAIWRRIAPFPVGMRRALAQAMLAVPPGAVDRAAAAFARFLPVARLRLPGNKLQKLGGVLDSSDFPELYGRLASFWRDTSMPVRGAGGGKAMMLHPEAWPRGLGDTETMMAVDAATYLPDDILVKVDRASMAVSLEARVPFLDPDLYGFAWRLPLALKLRDGVGKWIVRQSLYRRVPARLIERPKMGFGVPIGEWLRGPLREWAESLLSEEAIARSGLLEPGRIRSAWEAHLACRGTYEYHLWNVLMFQAWLQDETRAA